MHLDWGILVQLCPPLIVFQWIVNTRNRPRMLAVGGFLDESWSVFADLISLQTKYSAALVLLKMTLADI